MSVVYSGDKITFADSSVQSSAPIGFKNKIINGDFRIDQRNAGASVTIAADGQYSLDRWALGETQHSKFTIQQNAGSVTPPAGFINYLGATVASAVTIGSGDIFVLNQRIEGLNCADLGWGTANAKTVTLSAWVYSSLTGTFGGSIKNSAANRSYPFTYTISSANTWTQISVTIPGDTTGTWLKTNGIGMTVNFSLGTGSTYSGTSGAWAATNYNSATGAVSVVGTSGATFYITGVQLEVGSTASAFEVRDYGRELALCQRYYEKSYNQGVVPGASATEGSCWLPVPGVNCFCSYPFSVEKRTSATMLVYDTAGNLNNCSSANGSATVSTGNAQGAAVQYAGTRTVTLRNSNTISGAITIGYQWTASAEL